VVNSPNYNVCFKAPSATFQTLTVVSYEPLANCVPSTLKSPLLTVLVWPERVLSRAPVEVFHNLQVSSYEQVANIELSGFNFIKLTTLEWVNVWSKAPVEAVYIFEVESVDYVITLVESEVQIRFPIFPVWPLQVETKFVVEAS